MTRCNFATILEMKLTHPQRRHASRRSHGAGHVLPPPGCMLGRERSLVFLVTGVTMDCGDEPPIPCIVLARNKGQRTSPHRNCKNSLPRPRVATTERSKRCCERSIRSYVESSACTCSTGGCAAPWTPRISSNRCSRTSCANPRPASPLKRARPSCAPSSLPPCAAGSRRDCTRNALGVVFPRNGHPVAIPAVTVHERDTRDCPVPELTLSCVGLPKTPARRGRHADASSGCGPDLADVEIATSHSRLMRAGSASGGAFSIQS
jgi:hypothetical protein